MRYGLGPAYSTIPQRIKYCVDELERAQSYPGAIDTKSFLSAIPGRRRSTRGRNPGIA